MRYMLAALGFVTMGMMSSAQSEEVVRRLQVETPIVPSHTISGNSSCVKSVTFVGEKKQPSYTNAPIEPERQLYDVTFNKPCHAKVTFYWHSSPNDTSQRGDSFMQADLAE